MDSRPILFCDSGVGGLPYLAWVRDRLRDERFVYVADNANFPYGEKPPEELRQLVVSLVGRLLARFAPKLVVIACNTASVVALAALRATYSIPFVGVVPAVKPAAERSQKRKIALLATTRTVGDAYSDELIRQFASDCTVVRVAGQQLVSFIENDYLDAGDERIRAAMETAIAPLRAENIDSLILGCTHFTFLDRELREQLGSSVEIVDSREGVGRQVIRLVRENGFRTVETDANAGPAAAEAAEATLFHTAPDSTHFGRFAGRFALQYGGVLM